MKAKMYILKDNDNGEVKLVSMNLQDIFVQKSKLELDGDSLYIMTMILDIKTNTVEMDYNVELNHN